MGNPVISVDPNPYNQALLFNSLALNDFDESESIQVMNAISDGHYEYTGTKRKDSTEEAMEIYLKSPNSHTTITLMDIFNLRPNNEVFIVKIDIQGFECKAFEEYLKIKDKLQFVPYIQMEVSMICLEVESNPCKKNFKSEFLPLLESAGYTPHVPWPITYQEVKDKCYFDVLFVHKNAKAFPYWDKHLSKHSWLTNYHYN